MSKNPLEIDFMVKILYAIIKLSKFESFSLSLV